jgi:AmiR/NasT family two-component response regulator
VRRGLEVNFAGWRALILHPMEQVQARIGARLAALGIAAEGRWPGLGAPDPGADLLLVDLDSGHDDQLPWSPGQAPMPLIALIGSESPGRLSWAIAHRADAYLPLAAPTTLYSAVVLAAASHASRAARAAQDAETARRASLRLSIVRAVNAIVAQEGIDDETALKRLRAYAMARRLPLEDAAAALLADGLRQRRA